MHAHMHWILDAAYNKSIMSQASVYHWYNKLKSGRKSAVLTGGPDTPRTALTEQLTIA